MADQSGVTDNADEGRYELAVDGQMAMLAYHRRGDTIFLTHTEVPEAMEGQGIGSRIVKHALDAARAAGDKVAPWCPFVRAYIDRHPEYEEIVTQEE
ncbi:GNAT family N-acetyltransferase [Longimicrobium sp.]|uniref:GNAT family N-acetyltransferase n=1 Tax=Longimicrobium sp. TaxID=2029185 RepID=UPI002E351EF3|nr:GNAT family N-acetyltransferase [Longimicrobium sp.]HEX6040551.1 GNAT family N-acetyltransferase [Longimicrobium sp.]